MLARLAILAADEIEDPVADGILGVVILAALTLIGLGVMVYGAIDAWRNPRPWDW